MDLFEQIFGKKLFDYTKDDLVDYFSEEQEESSLIEFKSGKVELDSIYKEVCAFLNSEGGILIIGSPNEVKRNLKSKENTFCKGELIPSNFRSSDWLLKSIISNISPPPHNIKIQSIEINNGKCFIINVPQSITPPHQNNRDGKYYIRIDTMSTHAPHGVIEALFFKRQKAILDFHFDLLNKNFLFEFKFVVENKSTFPTEKIFYSINFFGIEKIFGGVTNSPTHNIMQNGEHLFTIYHTVDIVLWKGMPLIYNYQFKSFSKPFYISITLWSRDVEIVSYNGIFDPVKMEFLIEENNDEKDKKGINFFIEYLNNIK